mmetsp:Transcript_21301/g.59084  ORF Transcript_21301/g.59084 Transcript_21301/m.59084 type:complete len:217 (-) Transcript_21301:472-1122(-)
MPRRHWACNTRKSCGWSAPRHVLRPRAATSPRPPGASPRGCAASGGRPSRRRAPRCWRPSRQLLNRSPRPPWYQRTYGRRRGRPTGTATTTTSGRASPRGSGPRRLAGRASTEPATRWRSGAMVCGPGAAAASRRSRAARSRPSSPCRMAAARRRSCPRSTRTCGRQHLRLLRSPGVLRSGWPTIAGLALWMVGRRANLLQPWPSSWPPQAWSGWR